MRLTEVRILLADEVDPALLAFVSITLDDQLTIHDLRLINGRGGPLLAMPSRKRSERCPRCPEKNVFSARFCSGCGKRLPPQRAREDVPRYLDVVFPLNNSVRRLLTEGVVQAFLRELHPKDSERFREMWASFLSRSDCVQ